MNINTKKASNAERRSKLAVEHHANGLTNDAVHLSTCALSTHECRILQIQRTFLFYSRHKSHLNMKLLEFIGCRDEPRKYGTPHNHMLRSLFATATTTIKRLLRGHIKFVAPTRSRRIQSVSNADEHEINKCIKNNRRI